MEIEIEISYASSDAEVADDVASALAKAEDISAGEPREARQLDPTTVIGLIGGVVGLTNALIDLRERLRKRKEARSVRAENESGLYIILVDATDEDLGRLVDGSEEEP